MRLSQVILSLTYVAAFLHVRIWDLTPLDLLTECCQGGMLTHAFSFDETAPCFCWSLLRGRPESCKIPVYPASILYVLCTFTVLANIKALDVVIVTSSVGILAVKTALSLAFSLCCMTTTRPKPSLSYFSPPLAHHVHQSCFSAPDEEFSQEDLVRDFNFAACCSPRWKARLWMRSSISQGLRLGVVDTNILRHTLKTPGHCRVKLEQILATIASG